MVKLIVVKPWKKVSMNSLNITRHRLINHLHSSTAQPLYLWKMRFILSCIGFCCHQRKGWKEERFTRGFNQWQAWRGGHGEGNGWHGGDGHSGGKLFTCDNQRTKRKEPGTKYASPVSPLTAFCTKTLLPKVPITSQNSTSWGLSLKHKRLWGALHIQSTTGTLISLLWITNIVYKITHWRIYKNMKKKARR